MTENTSAEQSMTKFLFFLLRELSLPCSSLTTAISCDACSWQMFNWDDSVAIVSGSGESSESYKLENAFDGDNGIDLNISAAA